MKHTKLIIGAIIIIILAGTFAYLLAYRVENFDNNTSNNTSQLNQTPEDQLMAKTPESTYKFKNYFLEREPNQAKVIKNEVTHLLPTGVLESDLIMSNKNQIRFSHQDSNSEEVQDNYRLSPHENSDGRHLRLYMDDKEGTNNAFQIWGGACTAQGDCSKSGTELHNFSDKPSYTIKGKEGDVKHEFNSTGNVQHKGHMHLGGRLGSEDINVRNRIYFTSAGGLTEANPKTVSQKGFGDLHDSDPIFIEKKKKGRNQNSLRITINDDKDNSLEVYGGSQHFDRNGRNEDRRLMELNGKGNLWTKDTVNTKDVNVRGRIYFSQAGISDEIDPLKMSFYTARRIHNSDPYYIEKIIYKTDRNGNRRVVPENELHLLKDNPTNESALRITMNDNGTRTVNNNEKEHIEIFAASCDLGHCKGPGKRIMNIRSDGRVDIVGSLYVNNKKIA